MTDDYKNSFVGTWDDADGFDIYEFKSNENLVITTGKEVTTYTYWIEDNGKQVLLYIFANGDEEATTYSFTLSGSNLTLYDTVTGNAVKQLIKRVSISAPTATAAPPRRLRLPRLQPRRLLPVRPPARHRHPAPNLPPARSPRQVPSLRLLPRRSCRTR